VGSTVVGVHGQDLANYYFDDTPDDATTWLAAGAVDSPAVAPILIATTLPDPPPNVDPIWSWIDGAHVAYPILSTIIGNVQHAKPITVIGHAAYDPGWFVSPHLTSILNTVGLHLVSAAEPGRALGASSGLPVAVLPSLDATSVTDTVFVTPSGVVTGSETEEGGGVFAALSSGPHPSARTGFIPVYSKVAGGEFIVGGLDKTTNQPTGDLWFLPAYGTATQIPLLGYTFTTVMAATYSFYDRHLWVLDRAPTGLLGTQEVHLVRVDVSSGQADLIGKWGWLSIFDTDYIVVDRDGSLILASSYGGLGAAYYVGRVTMVNGQPQASLLAASPGRLLAPPMVDERGYGFLVRGLDGTMSTVRLGLKPSWQSCAFSALGQLL
jgi:hypothetical protein